jgi:DEAD/DEAH box helicase domain-containing protein
MYSAAFILRSVVAEQLDIDPEELEISNVRQVDTPVGAKVGEIIISDRLANGAGFTSWLANNLESVLKSIVIEPPVNSYVGAIVSEYHKSNCDSSCYDCLRQYRNMSYHGLLDWRLGLSYLRGLDADFSLPDLESWPRDAAAQRDSFCKSFGCVPHDYGPLPGLEIGARQVIIVHPLWDTSQPSGILAEAIAATTVEPRYIDTFNILRRPSAAYQWLGE